MDEVDQVQEREARRLSFSLAALKPLLANHDGMCIWCEDEEVVANSVFCSAECGEDYHKYKPEKWQWITGD